MPQLDSKGVVGDWLKMMLDEEYHLESALVTNVGGTAYTDVSLMGLPVIWSEAAGTAQILEAGAEASATGFLVTQATLSSLAATTGTTTQKYPLIARGPAVVWKQGLPVNDPLAAAYDWDALELRFEALSPTIIVRKEMTGLLTTTQEN